MVCYNCENTIHGDYNTVYGDIWCEECYNDVFTTCDRCEGLIRRDDVYDGDLCQSCYDERQDDPEAPDDPYVDNTDRQLIVQLARDCAMGKVIPKYTLKVNIKDYELPKLKKVVGLVEKSLYVFGLRDDHGYQLMVSEDLLPRVVEFRDLFLKDYIIESGPGAGRIGVSYSLRDKHFEEVVKLIKYISCNQLEMELV